MSEGIHFTIPRWQRTFLGKCSFGNNDDRRIVARKPMFDERTHLVYMKRALRNKYCVRTAGDAGVPCDPTRVSSHDLDNEHAVVTLRCRMQSIDSFSCNRHGCVKTERVVGGSQIVVDGLRYAHDRKADLCEFGRHAQSVLTPDDNKTFDTQATYCVENPPLTVVISIRIGSAGPQDRASPREDATNSGHIEWHRVPFHGSSPAVTKSNELVTVDLDTLAYDGADHGVQTRAVAAASQHSYTHGRSVPRTGLCPDVG